MNQVTNRLNSGFNKLLSLGGNQILIKYYSQTTGSIYDEAVSLAQSGNTTWLSGLVMPTGNTSDDQVLLQQGKIGLDDLKIYVAGNTNFDFTGSVVMTKIGIGSPSSTFYSLLAEGTETHVNEDQLVYKTAYIRKLINGSFAGE